MAKKSSTGVPSFVDLIGEADVGVILLSNHRIIRGISASILACSSSIFSSEFVGTGDSGGASYCATVSRLTVTVALAALWVGHSEELPVWVVDWQKMRSVEVWRQAVLFSLHSGQLQV